MTALGCMPHMTQLFVAAPEHNGHRPGGIDLDRRVYPLRKRAESGPEEVQVYFPSLSSRTMAYKGMLTTMQLPRFFPDLRDERCRSAIAIVHSRFSTNTFPSWPLAHPFRFVAHNGEINTVRGNRNRMHAREAMLASARIPGDLSRLSPVCTPGSSDSTSFDQVLELLHLGGRSLPHAVLMMIPEAWENNTTMDPAPPGVLAVPRLADGAVGRSCLRDLHRRHGRRSGLGPQRITAGSLVAHHRRQDHPGQRERRAGRAVGRDRGEGPAGARQDVPHRHRRWPHRVRRRDQGRAGRGRAVRRMAAFRPSRPQDAAGPGPRPAQPRVGGAQADLLRLHRGGAPHHAHPDGCLGRGAVGLHGNRHPGGGAVAAVASALRLLRRTLRPGDQPASGRHPRRRRHLDGAGDGTRAQPARTVRGVVPPDRAAAGRCSTTTS